MNIIILDENNNPITDPSGKQLIFHNMYKPQAFYDTYIKNMYPQAVKWVEYREENTYTLNLEFVRKRRNDLLTSCDWTVLPDVDLSLEKKNQWLEYRTALRDITENFDMNKPQLIIWPIKP